MLHKYMIANGSMTLMQIKARQPLNDRSVLLFRITTEFAAGYLQNKIKKYIDSNFHKEFD